MENNTDKRVGGCVGRRFDIIFGVILSIAVQKGQEEREEAIELNGRVNQLAQFGRHV